MTTTVLLYDPNTATDHDITSEVYSVETGRGKSRELDEIPPGTCTIKVHNLSGNFNPYFLTENSFLLLEQGGFLLLEQGGRLILESIGVGGTYGIMTIGRKLTVLDGAEPIFTGFTEDFDFDWAHGNIADATIYASDGLARLARNSFVESN